MNLTEGARRFRAFRTRNGINYSDAARELRVSRPAVYAWEDGSKTPEADARDRIEVWTKGEVTPPMWRTEEAERVLSEVRPHGETPDDPPPDDTGTFRVCDCPKNGTEG